MPENVVQEVETLTQTAPYPTILAELVRNLSYRPGWTFHLRECQRDEDHGRGVAGGLTFIVFASVVNSYDFGKFQVVGHYFIVPAATYDERAWRRWLFNRIVDVETHEAMEFFTISGVKPFAPIHAPGADPYTVTELATDTERRTSFRGVVNG